MQNNIKKFFKINFYILEAEEASINKNKSKKKRIRNKSDINKKNNKYIYGISKDKNDTLFNNNTSIELKKLRILFNEIITKKEKINKNENKKFLKNNSKDTNIKKDQIPKNFNIINIKKDKTKRKSDNSSLKKNDENFKKRLKKHINKNIEKIDNSVRFINRKLNISFNNNNNNNNNNNINLNNNGNEIEEKHLDDVQELESLKNIYEYNKIKDFAKNNNIEFIQRIKDNNSFLANNNIILSDKYNNEKKKNHNLKLYQLKGCYLNKKI